VEMKFSIQSHTIPPQSSSRRKFREWLVTDLAALTDESKNRFVIHEISQSGLATVQLTILPRTVIGQQGAVEISHALQKLMQDGSSKFYDGSITSSLLPDHFKMVVFQPNNVARLDVDARKQLASGYGRAPEVPNAVYNSPTTARNKKHRVEYEKRRDPVHYVHLSQGSGPYETMNKLWHPVIQSPNYEVAPKDDAFEAAKTMDMPDNRTSELHWEGYDLEHPRNKAKQTAFTQNFHLETTQYHIGAEGPRKTLKGLVLKRTTHEGLYERPKEYNRRVRSDVFSDGPDNISDRHRYSSTYSRTQTAPNERVPLKKPLKVRDNRTAFQAANSLNPPWKGADYHPGLETEPEVSDKVHMIMRATDPVGCSDPHAHKRKAVVPPLAL